MGKWILGKRGEYRLRMAFQDGNGGKRGIGWPILPFIFAVLGFSACDRAHKFAMVQGKAPRIERNPCLDFEVRPSQMGTLFSVQLISRSEGLVTVRPEKIQLTSLSGNHVLCDFSQDGKRTEGDYLVLRKDQGMGISCRTGGHEFLLSAEGFFSTGTLVCDLDTLRIH